MSKLDDGAIDGFKAAIRGEIVLPADAGYDGARSIWNAMIDRRPAVIVRCAGTADVMRSVTFAREQRLALAVRAAVTTSPAAPCATTGGDRSYRGCGRCASIRARAAPTSIRRATK